MLDTTTLVIGGGALGALLVLAAPVLRPVGGQGQQSPLETCASATAGRPDAARSSSEDHGKPPPDQGRRPRSSLIPNPALLRQRLR
jgi:hypothetical protein